MGEKRIPPLMVQEVLRTSRRLGSIPQRLKPHSDVNWTVVPGCCQPYFYFYNLPEEKSNRRRMRFFYAPIFLRAEWAGGVRGTSDFCSSTADRDVLQRRTEMVAAFARFLEAAHGAWVEGARTRGLLDGERCYFAK
jgi:hypothetical protein